MLAEKLLYDDLIKLVNALNEEHGLVYAVVGGFALDAWVGEKVSLIRENGTIRDVDVVVLRDPNGTIEKICGMNLRLPVDFRTRCSSISRSAIIDR